MRSLVVAVVVVVIGPLFAPAAPVPKHLMKDRPAQYFPTTVGTKWVYEDPNGEETLELVKVEVVNGAQVVSVVKVLDDRTAPNQRVAVSATQIARLAWSGEPFVEPLVMLKIPCRAGEKWEYDTAGVKGTDTIAGVERVTVPAGTFEAVRVDSVYTFVGKTENDSFWYAAGIGLVKMKYDGGKERVLKSFTPGK
jgi:hypothetical protein